MGISTDLLMPARPRLDCTRGRRDCAMLVAVKSAVLATLGSEPSMMAWT